MSLSSMSPQSKMGAAGGGVAVLGSASYLLYRVGPPQYVYYLTIGIILVGLLMGVFYFYMAFEAYHTARKRLAGEPVDIMVNGKLIARGDVVVIDDNFGVRITERYIAVKW